MKRKSYIVFYAIVCLVCLLSIVSYIVKIGVQYFARYDTPEEAFQRQIKWNVEIVDTVQHNDVAMVIYNTNKVSFSDKLFTKDEKGWYAPKNLTNQTIILDKGKGCIICSKKCVSSETSLSIKIVSVYSIALIGVFFVTIIKAFPAEPSLRQPPWAKPRF